LAQQLELAHIRWAPGEPQLVPASPGDYAIAHHATQRASQRAANVETTFNSIKLKQFTQQKNFRKKVKRKYML